MTHAKATKVASCLWFAPDDKAAVWSAGRGFDFGGMPYILLHITHVRVMH